MNIKIIISDGHSIEKLQFIGNYAFETMLIKLITKYYGITVASMVEDLLRERINGSKK